MLTRAVSIVALAGLSLSVHADPLQIRGSINEVTVYRGQALVSRAVPIDGNAGLLEVLVTDLPEHVVPASLYAEGGGGVEVRSVRYRIRPVLQDVNEEVRKLDTTIRDLDDKAKAVQRRIDLINEHKAYLAKLEGFVAPAANAEIGKGVLNAESLTSLTQLLLTQRQTAAENELKLAAELRSLNEQKSVAQRERDTIAGRTNKTVREAVVLVNLPAPAKGRSMNLKYLVNAAGWSPSYTVRADGKKDHVLVEYHAAIQQMSGEDWGDVAMTLSTATPSLVAKAPELKSMQVSLAAAAAQQQGDYANARKELAFRQKEVSQNRAMNQAATIVQSAAPASEAGGPGGIAFARSGGFDQTLNTLACDMQLLDLLSNDKVVRTTQPRGGENSEGLSITYTLASRTSLPSRADVQQVQIASLTMPAEFYKIATPVLTEYVYDEAQVVNDSKLVLLSGPAATYVEGRFVGSGEISTISSGEKFTVGLGIDSSLRTSRELVEKTDTVQGGNRVVDLTYRLTIDNFGQEASKVRLMDRLPKARESEIKLTLVDVGSAATEPDVQKKTGILRWDVTAPSSAQGKALAIEYKFRLEHDKQLTIAGMPLASK